MRRTSARARSRWRRAASPKHGQPQRSTRCPDGPDAPCVDRARRTARRRDRRMCARSASSPAGQNASRCARARCNMSVASTRSPTSAAARRGSSPASSASTTASAVSANTAVSAASLPNDSTASSLALHCCANRDRTKRNAPSRPNVPTASSTSRNGNAIVSYAAPGGPNIAERGTRQPSSLRPQ